jgi:hypothetical protein
LDLAELGARRPATAGACAAAEENPCELEPPIPDRCGRAGHLDSGRVRGLSPRLSPQRTASGGTGLLPRAGHPIHAGSPGADRGTAASWYFDVRPAAVLRRPDAVTGRGS